MAPWLWPCWSPASLSCCRCFLIWLGPASGRLLATGPAVFPCKPLAPVVAVVTGSVTQWGPRSGRDAPLVALWPCPALASAPFNLARPSSLGPLNRIWLWGTSFCLSPPSPVPWPLAPLWLHPLWCRSGLNKGSSPEPTPGWAQGSRVPPGH